MHSKSLLSAIFLLLVQTITAQQEVSTYPDKEKFSIDNCVNSFDRDKAVETKVGYQYWFADKDFLGDGRTLKMSVVAPHEATHAPHRHIEDEFFFVLEGTAEFYLEGQTSTSGPNTSFYCPSMMEHGIRNVGDTELKYLVIKKYELGKGK